MQGILHKWLGVIVIWFCLGATTKHHPLFVSVTEIEHNAKEKSLEISCKIFTDDFEKTLRTAYNTKVDLSDAKLKPAMDKLVNDYVQKHLKISADGKSTNLTFVGYERIDEGIYSYYEANNIATVKKMEIMDNILYEYKAQQIGLLHVTVGGKRQSTKLVNPESRAVMSF
jgi:hypothetical protein